METLISFFLEMIEVKISVQIKMSTYTQVTVDIESLSESIRWPLWIVDDFDIKYPWKERDQQNSIIRGTIGHTMYVI